MINTKLKCLGELEMIHANHTYNICIKYYRIDKVSTKRLQQSFLSGRCLRNKDCVCHSSSSSSPKSAFFTATCLRDSWFSNWRLKSMNTSLAGIIAQDMALNEQLRTRIQVSRISTIRVVSRVQLTALLHVLLAMAFASRKWQHCIPF